MGDEVKVLHSSVPQVYSSDWYWKTNSEQTNSWSQTLTSKTSHREGRNNPRWRQQVRLGQQAATTLSAYRYRYDVKPHFMHCKFSPVTYYYYPREGWTIGRYYSAGLTTPTVPPEMITKADNQAKSKYVSAANDARRVMQSGEMIGEFAELVRQVSSPGKSLRKGLGAYVETVKKRTQRKKVLRLPKYRRSAEQAKLIRDSWLEYQFGWRPLVSEINSVIDYVNEEDPFSRHDTRRIQGIGIAEDAYWARKTHVAFTQGPPAAMARERVKQRVLVRYRGQLRTRPSAEGYIAEKAGLHPADWLPTAWELVPYSFLIDYFVNIGDIISAFSLPSNSLGWTVKTVLTDWTTSTVDQYIDWSPRPGQTVNILSAEPGHATRSKRTVDRSPYSGSFIPDAEISIPGSGTRWLNMAALFIGSKKVEKLLR